MPFGERRAHVLLGERRSHGARPGNGLVPEQAREQVELLLEKRFVVGEVESEQRKGVDQRAATDDELCAAVRHCIESRELGVHPHRILRAQYRDGGAEPDAFGSAGDRGQHHVTRRVHEIGPVMLADVERVDTDGIGEDAFLDGVADDDLTVERLSGLVDAHIGGRIQSELNLPGCHRWLLASDSEITERRLELRRRGTPVSARRRLRSGR